MTAFDLEIADQLPNLAFVTVDGRFNIAIERTPDGLEIRVYPLIVGEIWDDPFETFTVDEHAITTLENQMED